MPTSQRRLRPSSPCSESLIRSPPSSDCKLAKALPLAWGFPLLGTALCAERSLMTSLPAAKASFAPPLLVLLPLWLVLSPLMPVSSPSEDFRPSDQEMNSSRHSLRIARAIRRAQGHMWCVMAAIGDDSGMCAAVARRTLEKH